MRIAIIADIHYSSAEQKTCMVRETGVADTILLRAVVRLNRLVRPDLTIVAGDLVNRGGEAYGPHDMAVIARLLKALKSPVIVIPGNHDGPADAFYSFFPRPERIVQFGNVRFVVNPADEERPGYNAWRAPHDIGLIALARLGFGGQLVVLQHTPCYPVGTADCPYNYLNAAEITAAEAAAGVRLSISGHHHEGFAPFRAANGVTYFAAPALCEPPFTIPYVDLDEATGRMEWHAEPLQLDRRLALVDTHIHTHLAYCNENLTLPKTQYLANMFGLKDFMLSEHSGHLLCSHDDYITAPCQEMAFKPEDWRGDAYFAETTAGGVPPAHVGLEADIRFDGSYLAHPKDLARAGFLIGAIHAMKCLRQKETPSEETLRDHFLWLCSRIVENGCLSLAHPFRIFRRAGLPIPPGCFEPLVRMLKESGTAAEINFHTNEPPVEFFRMAIDAGVKLTLGSDTHNLYEIGDFALHLDFLKRCGVDANYGDVLLPLP